MQRVQVTFPRPHSSRLKETWVSWLLAKQVWLVASCSACHCSRKEPPASLPAFPSPALPAQPAIPFSAVNIPAPRYTFTPMFTTMASRRSKTREVMPSPRSLASQQLQRNMYLVPWVGTAKHSSSTSQQLSGEAPSWPS